MMKLRRFGILWIGIMALTFTACSSSKSDNQSVKAEVTEITEETEKAAEETESVQEIKSTDEEVQEDSKPTYLDISLEEINTLVFASHYVGQVLNNEDFVDLENLTEGEKGFIVSLLANGMFNSSTNNKGMDEESNWIFDKDYNIVISQCLPFDLATLGENKFVKETEDSYLIPIGDVGAPLTSTRLIDYQVVGDEVIIEGCIEGYEDENREELLVMHNFTVYGEYNEYSDIGNFQLKKIVVKQE